MTNFNVITATEENIKDWSVTEAGKVHRMTEGVRNVLFYGARLKDSGFPIGIIVDPVDTKSLEWDNGTGYLDGAMGETIDDAYGIVLFTDQHARRGMLILEDGRVMAAVFQRYTDNPTVVVGNYRAAYERSLKEFYPSVGTALMDEALYGLTNRVLLKPMVSQ